MKFPTLEYLAPSQMKPRKRAWRTHDRRQIEALERSLAEFGIVDRR